MGAQANKQIELNHRKAMVDRAQVAALPYTIGLLYLITAPSDSSPANSALHC